MFKKFLYLKMALKLLLFVVCITYIAVGILRFMLDEGFGGYESGSSELYRKNIYVYPVKSSG